MMKMMRHVTPLLIAAHQHATEYGDVGGYVDLHRDVDGQLDGHRDVDG